MLFARKTTINCIHPTQKGLLLAFYLDQKLLLQAREWPGLGLSSVMPALLGRLLQLNECFLSLSRWLRIDYTTLTMGLFGAWGSQFYLWMSVKSSIKAKVVGRNVTAVKWSGQGLSQQNAGLTLIDRV
jgi:hypothetical protein